MFTVVPVLTLSMSTLRPPFRPAPSTVQLRNTTKDGADFINITGGQTITSSVVNGNGGATQSMSRTRLFTRSTAGGGKGNDSVASVMAD